MEFNYKITEKGQYAIVALSGNLIEKSQAALLVEAIDHLINSDCNKFILELSEFKYLNSTGLNIFVNILTKARKADGEVIVCSVPEKIKELMIITKLNTVFIIEETLEKAVQKIISIE